MIEGGTRVVNGTTTMVEQMSIHGVSLQNEELGF